MIINILTAQAKLLAGTSTTAKMNNKSIFSIFKSIKFMNTSNGYLLLIFCLLTFISCNKEEDKSADELLVGGTWIITELWEDHGNDGNFDIDDDNEMGSCEADNTLSFQSSGEVIFSNGILKCDPNEETTGLGLWTLSADEKILTLSDDKYTSPYILFSLNAHQMELHEIEDGRLEMRIVLEKK